MYRDDRQICVFIHIHTDTGINKTSRGSGRITMFSVKLGHLLDVISLVNKIM